MSVDSPIVVVSNRGPYTFALGENGSVEKRTGSGGLVSSLAPVLAEEKVIWIAAAMSAEDRVAGEAGDPAEPIDVHFLDIDPELYRRYYGDIANSTLWFVHHGIADKMGDLSFDIDWHRSWSAYRYVNKLFAQAAAESAPRGSVVLVQDYHLALVGGFLRQERPDLTAVHFSHTPFSTISEIASLPDAVVRELLQAMASYDACGFHCARWEEAFLSCCARYIGEHPRTFVAPLGPDRESLKVRASSEVCVAYQQALRAQAGNRELIVRVDRMDPTKNLLRGFLAFEELLDQEPRRREKVVFVALTNLSRQSVAEYGIYHREVENTVSRINARFGTPEWTPILLCAGDNLDRSIAAMCLYDVLLVNPVRDGLNLVAKEAPLVNSANGVVVLSRECGSWSEMRDGVIGVHPLDIFETRRALARALDLSRGERNTLSDEARRAASLHDGRTWLAAQLHAAGESNVLSPAVGWS